MQTENLEGQVSLFDQDTWCGKTSWELCPATKGATSRRSSKKRSESQSRKPPIFQCLKRDGLHTEDSATWTDDGLWLGECWTRNTGECPNVAVESRLSQILEARPHTKYSLTAKACEGILRRAERRGKDLPAALKKALRAQSASGGGCDGGGKGALAQTEKSGTLGCNNDQTLFQNALTPWDTQTNRVYGDQGVFPPLQAREKCGMNRESVFCLQGNGINRSDEAGCAGKGWREDVSYTLNTIDRPAVCAAFKLGNSETARSIGFAEEQAPTLNAECGGNKPAVMCFDMTHANDVIRECGDVVPTLQSRIETGGNQVPLTYAWERSDSFSESDISCTQSARQGKSATDLSVQHGIVRRLTPTECERLQGFPDGWTDIGAWTDEKGKLRKESSDSARYKALGNSIALPPWKWVLKRICAQYERDATMGSLFDGIGGFPLLWIQLNGWGSVKWASEIEPFCIAVTKRHFGEGENSGDAWEYLTGVKNGLRENSD